MPRIVAIEPDRERAVTLQRLMRENLDAEVVLTSSAGDALDTFADVPPDLILTSSLLAPGEDEQLAAHLRAVPDLDHLPVLTIPPLVETTQPAPKPQRFWARLLRRRRPQEPWRTYDFGAIAERIEEALEQSKYNAPESEIERPARLALLETRRTLLLGAGQPQSRNEVMSLVPVGREISLPDDLARWRARARRWSGAELPWLSEIYLTWGAPTRPTLRLINISSTGVLVESDVQIAPGNKARFQLAGSDEQRLIVRAEIVRVDASALDAGGLRFVVAATFDRPFESLGPVRSMSDLRRRQRMA